MSNLVGTAQFVILNPGQQLRFVENPAVGLKVEVIISYIDGEGITSDPKLVESPGSKRLLLDLGKTHIANIAKKDRKLTKGPIEFLTATPCYLEAIPSLGNGEKK